MVNKVTELPRFIVMGSRCRQRGLNPVMAIGCNLSHGANFSKYSSFYERPVVFMLDPLNVVLEEIEVFFKRVCLLVMEYFKSIPFAINIYRQWPGFGRGATCCPPIYYTKSEKYSRCKLIFIGLCLRVLRETKITPERGPR
jgi:hypothetical protein